MSYAEAQYTIDELKGNGGGVAPGLCKFLTKAVDEDDAAKVSLTWKDPSDTYIDGQLITTWASTTVVRKKGGYPESILDGTTVAVNTERDAHRYDACVDQLAEGESGDDWYYMAFPASDGGAVSTNEKNRFGGGEVLFCVRITESASDAEARVEYPDGYDNSGFTPAHMDYDVGEFDYGDWEDAFFMPKPCMLKSDGTVDYFLDADNYNAKTDGTASDITDTDYDGNAMMQWPKIWSYYTNDGTYTYIYISNVQYNSSFTCYSNHDKNGSEIDYFYTPIYDGSAVNSVLRSMSGLTPINTQTGTTEATYALANGDGWDTETFCDRQLINALLVLIGRTTDTQTTFGNGHYTGGSSASDLLKTGTMDKKGLFWGTNGTGEGVKVFGMENWWGNEWRRIRGLMNSSGKLYYKLTYGTEDGTSVTGWNTTSVSGYLTPGSLSGTSGGYISAVQVTSAGGIFPKTVSGSSTTYYCDGCWWSTSAVTYAYVGGRAAYGFLCGAFAVNLNYAVSYSGWGLGASVSCKPTAAA